MSENPDRNPPAPRLIAVDWGTTTFRAYLLGNHGDLITSMQSGDGLLSVKNGAFAETLTSNCGNWCSQHGAMPVLMCGMVGSMSGWAEVPYLSGTSSVEDLAAGTATVRWVHGDAQIVPGITCTSLDGHPDVMRGEETISAGALHITGRSEGLLCLPGTHSKWILLKDRLVAAFSTYMTGELFALLSRNGILAATFPDSDERNAVSDWTDFAAGVELSRESGSLSHKLFVLRAGKLTGRRDWRTYGALSGLLVGSEIGGLIDAIGGASHSITVAATGPLGEAYSHALDLFGLGHDVLDAEECVRRGLWEIYRAGRA